MEADDSLPGQRMSKCTCSGDHAGPNRQTGRGAPEIDIIEVCCALIPALT